MMRFRVPGIPLTEFTRSGAGGNYGSSRMGRESAVEAGRVGAAHRHFCREAERERLWLHGHVLLRSARQPGAARAQECASIRTSLTPSRVAHASREAHSSLLDGRATRRQGWQTRPQSPLRFAFKTLRDVTLLYSLSCFSIAKVTYVHLKFYPIHRKF